jgi:hypothetical protein
MHGRDRASHAPVPRDAHARTPGSHEPAERILESGGMRTAEQRQERRGGHRRRCPWRGRQGRDGRHSRSKRTGAVCLPSPWAWGRAARADDGAAPDRPLRHPSEAVARPFGGLRGTARRSAGEPVGGPLSTVGGPLSSGARPPLEECTTPSRAVHDPLSSSARPPSSSARPPLEQCTTPSRGVEDPLWNARRTPAELFQAWFPSPR